MKRPSNIAISVFGGEMTDAEIDIYIGLKFQERHTWPERVEFSIQTQEDGTESIACRWWFSVEENIVPRLREREEAVGYLPENDLVEELTDSDIHV